MKVLHTIFVKLLCVIVRHTVSSEVFVEAKLLLITIFIWNTCCLLVNFGQLNWYFFWIFLNETLKKQRNRSLLYHINLLPIHKYFAFIHNYSEIDFPLSIGFFKLFNPNIYRIRYTKFGMQKIYVIYCQFHLCIVL